MESSVVLALDQGTTSSRAILFSHNGTVSAVAQQEFEQIFPKPGHVEHDPEKIWQTQLATARDVASRVPGESIDAIGITNQRETAILWERDTGKPVANAIVWQSRVSSGICDELKSMGFEEVIRSKTGLLLDAYFSGTKVLHLLRTMDGLRSRAERGEILFGTVDSFLVWRLTGGRHHVTDASNASRTLLYNIHSCEWDDELLTMLEIPRAMLPEVKQSSEVIGESDEKWFGRPIPISGIAGDQQAATFGQACFDTGDAKNTYGTGCFMLLNTGDKPVSSDQGLLTTIGWQRNGETTYCLEGSIFVGGAVVQWLRDGLQLIDESHEVEALAATIEDNQGVYIVPAFVGLGAPHWDAEARGTIVGITRGTDRAVFARAALESIAYQTCDVLDAMQRDSGVELASLKVDGGASANNLLMQFQSDLLSVPVIRPQVKETTALGAAYLAGLATGFWESQDDVRKNWSLEASFEPRTSEADATKLYRGWQRAVQRSLQWCQND